MSPKPPFSMADLLVSRRDRIISVQEFRRFIAQPIPKPTTSVPGFLVAPSAVLGRWLKPSEASVKEKKTWRLNQNNARDYRKLHKYILVSQDYRHIVVIMLSVTASTGDILIIKLTGRRSHPTWSLRFCMKDSRRLINIFWYLKTVDDNSFTLGLTRG